MLKLYSLLAWVSLFVTQINAQLSTFSTGLGGGEWYDNTVWTNNSPACGLSFAEIAAADDVTIDNSFNLSTCTDPIYLSIRGSLLLTESNVSIDLPCNSEIYVYKNAKILDISPDGGNSISICGQLVWEFDQNPSADGVTHMFVNSLPVELSVFDVQTMDNQNIVHWVTDSETNNSHFVLERSYNGMTFEAITTTVGAGDSKVQNSYSFIDANFSSNVVYYRLKQFDFDGTMHLSPVIVAENDPISSEVLIFPNPSRGDVQMIIDQTMVGGVAQILDLNGRLVQTIQLNNNTISLHRGELANGVYHIQLQNNGIVKHQRLQFIN